MSKENVELIEALVFGTVNMDKQALLAALPGLIEQVAFRMNVEPR